MNNFKISKLIVAVVSIGLLNSCTEDPQPDVIIDFDADNVEILESNSVKFNNSSKHAETYEWQFDGGSPGTSSSESPTVSYSTAGVYSVSLTASNEDNKDTQTKSSYITVMKEAISNFSVSNTSITVNSSITFDNLSKNADSYQWTFEGGEPATSTSQNPSVTYTESGNHTVTLIAKNKLSESTESKSAYIKVENLPASAAFTGNKQKIQTGDQVTFSNSSSNATSYKWTFEGGNPSTSTDSNPTILYSNPGTFNVSLEAKNQDGKTDTETKSNYIEVLEPVDADFTMNTTSIIEGQTVTFNSTSAHAISYSWTFEGGTPSTSTAKSPAVKFNQAGSFNVSLTARNDVSSETRSININVNKDPNLNLPPQFYAERYYDIPGTWRFQIRDNGPTEKFIRTGNVLYYFVGSDITKISNTVYSVNCESTSGVKRTYFLKMGEDTNKISISQNQGTDNFFYKVVGRTINKATFNGGEFRKVSGSSWVEAFNDGNTNNFTEFERDDWSVYLEKADGATVQIDVFTRTINIKTAGSSSYQLLYNITEIYN